MDYKPLDHIKESLPPDINEKDCYLGGWELLPASKYQIHKALTNLAATHTMARYFVPDNIEQDILLT